MSVGRCMSMFLNVCSYGMVTFDSVDLRRIIFSPRFTEKRMQKVQITRKFTIYKLLLTMNSETIHFDHHQALLAKRPSLVFIIKFGRHKYPHCTSGLRLFVVVDFNCICERRVL